MISVTCKQCGSTLKVSEDKAGMKGRCPQCKAILSVPNVASPQPERMIAPVVEETPAAPVAPAPAPEAVDPLQELSSVAAASAPAAVSPTIDPVAAAPQPVQHAAPAHAVKPIHPPRYAGVNVLGWVYIVLGFLMCAAGLVIPIVTAIVGIASQAAAEDAGLGMVVGTAGIGSLITGGALLVIGFMQIGMGQLFHCVRDIAQNTCYLRRL